MPYEETEERDKKGKRLYRTPSGKKVNKDQIALIESRKRNKSYGGKKGRS